MAHVLDHVDGLLLTGAFTGRHEVSGNLLRARGVDDGPCLQETIRQRFVHENVHSFLPGPREKWSRGCLIWRHHFYRGHVLLLFQQLAEVHVGRTSLVLFPAALLRVVGFHDLLADIAAAGHVVRAFSPGRVADQSPDCVPDVVLAPFQVVDPILLDVTHGDDLDVRAGENSADFPDRLSPESDTGQSNFVTRRDKSSPSQHMPWHNGEGGGGRTASQH